METLSARRLQRVLHATAQAVEFRDLSEFRVGVTGLVSELIPCGSVSYNEIKPGESAIVIGEPVDWLTAENLEIFATFAGENPLVTHYARTGDGTAVRISDFLSTRRLHRLTLYDQLYRHIGIEHQIAFVLPSPPGEVVGIALNRDRHDFTTEEAAVLDLLRAPLRACHARLSEREQLLRLLSDYEHDHDIAARATALGLSERQVEVIVEIVGGASNAAIAMRLGISRRTVEKHLQHIYARLDVTSRTQAIDRVHARPSL